MQSKSYVILALTLFLGFLGIKEAYTSAAQYSCWAGGYKQDAWLAYCNSERYGVYDVDAVWHRWESDVEPAIARAQVLTLSDSHLQSALSLGNASVWFAERGYPLYMLGLPTAESGSGERLLTMYEPHPEVVILDASPYFTGNLGTYEESASQASDPTDEMIRLKGFQSNHQKFCEWFNWACGRNFAYFRSRQDGHWIFPANSSSFWLGSKSVPNDDLRYPVSQRQELLKPYPTYLAAARKVVDKLTLPRECIVLTHVPADNDLRDLPEYLAKHLGVVLIAPQVPDLATFDRAHLTPDSSRRWTAAFLEKLQPVLDRCVSDSRRLAARS